MQTKPGPHENPVRSPFSRNRPIQGYFTDQEVVLVGRSARSRALDPTDTPVFPGRSAGDGPCRAASKVGRKAKPEPQHVVSSVQNT